MTGTKRGTASRLAVALCLYAAVAGSMAAAETSRASAGAAATEEELFARLFDAPSATPGDLFVVEAIEAEGGGFTKEYLESFARDIKVGDRLRRSALEARASSIGERLRLSGMFYSSLASVEFVESPAGSNRKARLRIAVSGGFWWGFDFSPWDISLGYANLLGEGKRGQLVLGLNTQSLSYLDPSIGNGALYYSLGLRHSLTRYESDIDPEYLGEVLAAEGSFGIAPIEDVRIGFCAGYLGLDSPTGYFLYPGYSSPPPAALASLGLSSSREDFGKLGIELRSGESGYQRRGGLGARLSAGLYGYFPNGDARAPVYLARADGNLRYDFPGLARLAAYGRAEYSTPLAAGSEGSAVPALLRASIAVPGPAGDRCARGLVSGELAALGRLSLGLDPVFELGLGFTGLRIIPELYYELALVSRAAYSSGLVGQQDAGALVKLAFASPVNRVFSFGFAFGFPGLSSLLPVQEASKGEALRFVFEIE